MASPVNQSSNLRYLSFGTTSSHPDESSSGRCYPVNIYSSSASPPVNNKKTFIQYIRCICCCKSSSHEEPNPSVDDLQSALVRPLSRKKYTIQKDEQKQETPINNQLNSTLTPIRPLYSQIPELTVTQAIDNEISKSTTKLLLSSEKISSSVSQSTPKYKVRKLTPSSNDCSNSPRNSANNSRSSTLKFGEKVSFIHEILDCRDSFLKSMEWFDNSLTRGKKYRTVKRDEWIELRNDSGTIESYRHRLPQFQYTQTLSQTH